MDRLYNLVTHLASIRLRWDDDFVDRLHHVYTSFILVLLSIIVSSKQYVGDPIYCWAPDTWSLGHQRYADNVCWITNTYWIAFPLPVPHDPKIRGESQISYYQWVPFVLLLQALMFYFPCGLWRVFNDKSGVNLKSLVEIAVDTKNVNPEYRQKTINHLSKYLIYAFEAHKDRVGTGRFERFRHMLARSCLIFGKKYGNYLVLVYTITKILYLANICGQLFLMNFFLGIKHKFYGIAIFSDFWDNEKWLTHGRFPRVTMCDFLIRVMGNVHRHTIQCVLPINMFNEKVYIFLWFWFFVLAVITIFNLIFWIFNMSIRSSRYDYIKNSLNLRAVLRKEDKFIYHRFVSKFLRWDGVFVMKLIAKNAGVMVAHEIIESIWRIYRDDFTNSVGLGNGDGLMGYHPRSTRGKSEIPSEPGELHSVKSNLIPTAPSGN